MANNQYVNKVDFGDDTLIDLTSDTVTEDTLVAGYTAHTRSGATITGTLSDATTSTHGLMSANDKSKLDGITSGAAVTDVQINSTSILNNGVANVPVMTAYNYGVAKINNSYGVKVYSGQLYINKANSQEIQAGKNSYYPIVPNNQHESVFYGLSKVAGVDLKNETVTLGTYPATAIAAIKSMLGVHDVEVVRLA